MANGREPDDRSAADHDVGQDNASLQARLARLSEALERRQQQSANEVGGNSTRQSFDAANLGFRALVEFVTAIVVAPLVGWQIDAWLKTGPLFLIIFLMLGMVAGLVNVYRIAIGPAGQKRDSK